MSNIWLIHTYNLEKQNLYFDGALVAAKRAPNRFYNLQHKFLLSFGGFCLAAMEGSHSEGAFAVKG